MQVWVQTGTSKLHLASFCKEEKANGIFVCVRVCVCVAWNVSRYLLNFHEIRLLRKNTPPTIRVTSVWIVHLVLYASSGTFGLVPYTRVRYFLHQ